MAKEYMTTDAQMRQLRSRGLKNSGSADKRILEKENFYNLINGYKFLFIDCPDDENAVTYCIERDAKGIGRVVRRK